MLLNRHTDARRVAHTPSDLPPLPVIDWSAIGASAPELVDLGTPAKDTPLPAADMVVMTWTNAEWAAFDHVFVNSGSEMQPWYSDFQKDWHWRAKPGETDDGFHLWGYYRMVKITDKGGNSHKVLLFKANAHLAYSPYAEGLMKMVELLCSETGCARLMSIGTAGGATLEDKLGDSVLTNSGTIKVEKPENTALGINGKTVTCDAWSPATDMFAEIEQKLLFKLSDVVTPAWLEYLLEQAIDDPEHGDPSWKGKYTVADMMNAAMQGLDHPRGLNKRGVPLLSTDYYFIASHGDSDQYSTLEMDDAVVGLQAQKMGVEFAFLRNISDPVVPDNTQAGDPIPAGLRENWSSQIYSHYGFYSSMNGALLAWSTIAGEG